MRGIEWLVIMASLVGCLPAILMAACILLLQTEKDKQPQMPIPVSEAERLYVSIDDETFTVVSFEDTVSINMRLRSVVVFVTFCLYMTAVAVLISGHNQGKDTRDPFDAEERVSHDSDSDSSG